FERCTAFAAMIIGLRRIISELAAKYASDPVLSHRIQELGDDVYAARSLLYKCVSEQQRDRQPGPASGALRLIATGLNHRIRRFAASAGAGGVTGYLSSFGLRIG